MKQPNRRSAFMRAAALAAAACTAFAALPTAHAHDYPTRIVKIVVTFSAGGGDTIGRLVARKLAEELKPAVKPSYPDIQEFLTKNIVHRYSSADTRCTKQPTVGPPTHDHASIHHHTGDI